ncbi:MAG: glucose 1-dehydrogenase [Chloroflexota bacterium]|nr:glucose 1-dehydrogenase [Chloroflexota bacterium]
MSLSLFSLESKVAIVTGAGRGIGKAIALGLADAGADIVVAARTADDIDATAREIVARGRKALAVPTDVRLSDQVTNLVEKTVAEFGRIDILVNNAGGSFNVSTMELSEGGWDAIIRENLKSVFLCSKAVAKVMTEHKTGSIVNIASIAGLRSYTANAAYGAAKAGIIEFTKTLAVDLAPQNIRVNCIAPGFIITEGLSQLHEEESGKMQERTAFVPLHRLGKPEDIVGAVIYLSSEASSYVTGQPVVIDGGLIINLGLQQ